MSKTKNQYNKFYTYKITNLINNKIYIGETHNFETRLSKHFNSARCGSQTYLHRSIRKHGENNFIIEKLNEFDLERDALDNEIKLISIYKSNDANIGYNLTSGGDKTKYNDILIKEISIKLIEKWEDVEYVKSSLSGKLNMTISDLLEIKTLYDNNVKINNIANIFDVDRHVISRILNGKSWKKILPFEPVKTNNIHQEESVYQVRQLVLDGYTYCKVGEILSLSESTVRKMAKGYNRYCQFNKIEPIKDNLREVPENIVNSIRDDFYNDKNLLFNALAKKYNLSANTVSKIICATGIYKHLTPLKEKSSNKFSKQDIIDIKNSKESITAISKKYKVDYKTIYNIVNNVSYKN